MAAHTKISEFMKIPFELIYSKTPIIVNKNDEYGIQLYKSLEIFPQYQKNLIVCQDLIECINLIISVLSKKINKYKKIYKNDFRNVDSLYTAIVNKSKLYKLDKSKVLTVWLNNFLLRIGNMMNKLTEYITIIKEPYSALLQTDALNCSGLVNQIFKDLQTGNYIHNFINYEIFFDDNSKLIKQTLYSLWEYEFIHSKYESSYKQYQIIQNNISKDDFVVFRKLMDKIKTKCEPNATKQEIIDFINHKI